MPERLGIIGCGKTATSVAAALREVGYAIAGLTCRTAQSAAAAANGLGDPPILATNAEVAGAASVVLIGVPDSAIAEVTTELRAAAVDLRGRTVLHLSGALDASVLGPLRDLGAAVGSLHPLQTFPERILEPSYLTGITFGIEGDAPAVAVARAMVAAVGGHPVVLAPGAKADYHAAASVACNHLTAVLGLAESLMQRAGLSDRRMAFDALLPLILQTLANVQARGAAEALTGPIVRGDAATVARHLVGLDGAKRRLYLGLAAANLELAARSPQFSPAAAHAVAGAIGHRPVRIVASLRGAGASELLAAAAAARGADFVEYRLDLCDAVTAADVDRLLAEPRPAIVTCRPGGAVAMAAIPGLLERALARGVRYVDLDLGATAGTVPRDRLILSWHGRAADAVAAARQIAERRPAIGKIAIELTTPTELLEFATIAGILRTGCESVAVVGMGPLGVASRVLARRLGSDLTYAAARPGAETASGQPAIGELEALYRIRHVGLGTRVFGLAGDPIGHSLSPRLLNRLLPELLGDVVYVPLPSGDAGAILDLARRLPLDGLSITTPLKLEVAARVDARLGAASESGSVNTVIRHAGRLYGYDTDSLGIATIVARFGLAQPTVLVVGAGAVARSAAKALCHLGATVHVVARRPDAARALAKELPGVVAVSQLGAVSWDLLVNATPLGMRATDPSPVAADQLTGRAVLDLVYGAGETRLMHDARALGLAVADGVDMLLAQAAPQIELFTGGETVSRQRLREAIA